MQNLFLLNEEQVIVQNNNKTYQDSLDNFILDLSENIPPMEVNGKIQSINQIDYNKHSQNCWLNGMAFQIYPNKFCEMVLSNIDVLLENQTKRTYKEPTQEDLNKQEAEVQKSKLREIAITAMMFNLVDNEITAIQNEYRSKLENISDDVALYMVDMFPAWNPNGVQYKKDKRVSDDGVLYKILQNHTSQENWKPKNSPSLFAKVISSISGEIPEWEQPLPTNAYKLGDRVKHNGRYYESTYDGANVWEPGVVGEEYWKDITDEIGEAS